MHIVLDSFLQLCRLHMKTRLNPANMRKRNANVNLVQQRHTNILKQRGGLTLAPDSRH